jgi:choline-glycine betaine transporter
MDDRNDAASQLRTDWPVFITTVLVVMLLLSVPIVAFKDQAAGVITAAYDGITRSVGVLYLWYGTGAVAVLLWLAFGRFGKAQAITAVISSLPWGTLVLATFTVVALLPLVTTYDSASCTLASVSTMRLEAGHDPARWNRVFWACALGVLMVLSLLKMLREDEALARLPGGLPS